MSDWYEAKIKDFADVKGGKRLPKGKQLVKEPNNHPYIRIRDLGKSRIRKRWPESSKTIMIR